MWAAGSSAYMQNGRQYRKLRKSERLFVPDFIFYFLAIKRWQIDTYGIVKNLKIDGENHGSV